MPPTSYSMRTLRLYFLSFVVVATVMVACRKEPELPTAKDPTEHGRLKSGPDCAPEVAINCGMLSFATQAEFQEAEECLDKRYEAEMDWFEQEHPGLDEDEFNDAIEGEEFDDNHIFIEFEQALGFYSYRANCEDHLSTYLDGGGDPATFTMPMPFSGPPAATLRNKYGAVMVAGTIFLTDGDGTVWEFCSCEMYELYISNPSLFDQAFIDQNSSCVTVNKDIFTGNGTICSNSWRQCWVDEYVAGSKKVKMTLEFQSSSLESEPYATIRAYKKKNGKWKKRFVKLGIRVHGATYDEDCSNVRGFNKSRPRKWRCWRQRGDRFEGGRTFQNQTVMGDYHYGPTPISTYRELDFINSCNGCGC